MTSNEGEPTHVCLDCGAKQAEPNNPLGWCCNCFGGEPIPITEVDVRIFPDNVIPKGITILELNNTDKGLFLSEYDVYGDSCPVATNLDLALLSVELRESVTNNDSLVHNRNFNAQLKYLMKAYKSSNYKIVSFRGEGYLYLGYSKKKGAYKIGLSKTPEKRAKNLRIKLLTTIPADNMGEGEFKLLSILHHKMAKDLIDTHGYEWFYLDEGDVNYIKSIVGYSDGRFTFEGGSK